MPQEPHPSSAAAVEARFQTTTELVAEARRRLSDDVWAFVCGGSETETTVLRNRQALDSIAFRPRVARRVVDTRTGTTFLGAPQRLPVMLAPLGSITEIEPNGCVAVARAAARFGCPMMMSSVGGADLETVAAAAGERFYFQLYVHGDAGWVENLARRAADAGCRGFCVTLDTAHFSRRERGLQRRYSAPGRPFGGSRRGEEHAGRTDWKILDRLKSRLTVPLVLKGIATAEDATEALEHGVDVIYVSNHGGRQLDHGRGAIDILPEVVAAVRGKARIVVDGGFSRGSDVLKALAMGADVVGLGRLQAWALAGAGETGLVRMLELLEAEITVNMRLLGVNRYAELDGSFLQPTVPVRRPHVLSAFPLLAEEFPGLFG
jgi:isopentenyl diphosphate isomerase/L-lactate dehydrogenase-like FMN-dependent dehydrogenase